MWRKTENRSDPTQDLKVNWHAEHIIETYFNEKQIQLFKTTNKKRPLARFAQLQLKWKQVPKDVKVNALNKSSVKHDEGILNNTQLCLISHDNI